MSQDTRFTPDQGASQAAALEHAPEEVRLESLTEAMLDAVLHIEQQAYSHPWTRGNFLDSFKAGYHLRALMGGDTLLGYYVAMTGVQEVHLLNITVAPDHQGQGYGRLLLDALHVWARQQEAQWCWLEVRAGNARAMRVYERYGYRRVGLRKGYYPDHDRRREDAVVMSYKL
jgi:ribosomal-protein-alanine N-acetyltransferase